MKPPFASSTQAFLNTSKATQLSRLVRSRPAPMALEQRFMFDGAAMADALETTDTVDIQDISGDWLALQPLALQAPSLYRTDLTDPALANAMTEANQAVRDFILNADDQTLFGLFSGGQSTPDAAWTERLAELRAALRDGSFNVNVVAMDSASVSTSIAAYTHAGPDGQPTVFINPYWFDLFEGADATRVLVEEFGHAVDDYLNPEADTAGDEGEAFAASALNGVRATTTTQNDHGTVTAGGISYEVEFASFSFTNAYQMITDINGDGIVDNTENWAEKEQESHTLLIANDYSASNGYGGLGPVVINDDTNSDQFSGNDVSAIGINIGGTNYYGWISRPLKIQGEVVAFYFWTDQDFTDLAHAQLDGNQDNDTADSPADPGVTDNKGFILVVDQSYFTGLISGPNATLATTTVTATGTTWSAINAGTYNSIEVGSSSDRVDNALNALLLSNTPLPLYAIDDVASGTPGTSGGAALEEGGDDNSPSLNTLTLSGNLVDTIDASGNVLDNDANAGGLKPIAVIGIASNSTNESASITSTTPGVIVGRYGSLTQNANGSYTYVIDNADPAVQALLSTSTPLQDVFTYTVNDGVGGTASATLTIQIKGSNDAPVAEDDYNVAKESLLTDGTEYTGVDTVGSVATGDVTLNDGDVDHTENGKTIVGIDETGAATAGTYTASGSSTTLTFTPASNALQTSVANGASIYWDSDADGSGNGNSDPVALAVYNATTTLYSEVTVSAPQANADGTTSFTLSATPTHYWNGTSWTAFTNVETQLSGGSKYFEFGSNSANNLAPSSAKGGVLETGGAEVTVSVDVTGTSGSIYAGMTVTALNGATSVLPAGTIVTKVNYDVNGNITSVELSNDFSPKPANPTGYALSFTMPTGGDSTITTAYGTLELLADGSYTYTPIAANPLLDAGETVVETFDYVMQDALGAKSTATLYITVVGSSANDPVAGNDTITAIEAGGVANGTAGTNPAASASPNRLIDNDTTNTTNFPNKYVTTVTSTETGASGNPAASSVAATIGTGPAVVVGKYGTFTIGADGSYVYTVNNDDPAVQALRTAGQTLTETFTYVVKSYNSTNTTLGGADTAVVTVTIQGANDTPMADDDSATATAGQAAATGNVFNNDTDVDAGDSKTVVFAQAGTTATPSTAVPAGSTSTSGTPLQITGQYGTLTLGADGSYTYAIDTNNATVRALGTGATTTETFSYQMRDTAGALSVATLEVTVAGRNDAPVNSHPASVVTAVDTPIAFTGGNAISVADVDGNLSQVVLHVDHGTLNATSTGGATVTGSGSGDLTISGTQAEINAILASLGYTPANGFYGTDFLTIYSRDSNAAFDSDGFAINIPTVTDATVKEPALASGSNAGSTEESFAGNVTLGSGQMVNEQQTGNIRDGSNNIIGTWQVNTDGSFNVTLTAGSSATSSSFTYEAIDSFGNDVNNTVNVSIVDDGPTAVADTNSTLDGGAAINGDVLSDGSDDVFGADGPAAGGGVVGIRAAGGDTSSEVSGGTGAPVAGLYGSLTLNADGSYTYTPASNALLVAATDVFVYTIEDADGTRSTTTLSITVNPPVATDADLVTTKVLTSGDTTPLEGDTVTFTITVSNNGAAQATGVSLTDSWPAGLDLVSATPSQGSYDSVSGIWSIGTLNNAATATLVLSGTVKTGEGGNTLTNTVTAASGNENDPSTAGDDLSESVTADALPVATNDTDRFVPGSPVTVSVVSNDTTGDTVVASTVVFTSVSASNGGKTLVVVNEGTWTIDPTTGAITFTPVAGFAGNPTAVEYQVADAQGNFDTATVTLAKGSADLVTTKVLTSSDATPLVGSTVTFTITVSNNGADTATGVHLTDSWPNNLTLTANTPSQGTFNTATGEWTIGTMANGTTATLVLSGTVNSVAQGTTITNTVTAASGDQSDPSTTGDDISESVNADALPVATNDTDRFVPGSPVTVNVVSNDTTGDTVVASTVVFTSVSASNGGKTLVVVNEGTWTIDPTTGAITFTPVAGFAGNPTAVEYQVADAQGNFDTATVTLAKGSADLVTTKVLTSSDATPLVGSTVTFTITVSNNGADTATGVHLTDSWPNNLTLTANTPSQGTFNTATGEWTIGTMANGTTATLVLSGTVNSVAQGTTIANTVTAASGDQSDPSTTGDDLNELVVVDTPTSPTPEPPLAPAPEPAPAEPPPAPEPTFNSATEMNVASFTPTLEASNSRVESTLTSDMGFPVLVLEPSSTTLPPNLSLANAVTDQFAELGATSSFALPYDTFAHTKSDAQITLTAKLQDGSDLPNWVQFDPQSGSFTVTPPANLPADQRELKLMVIARDQEGREAVAPFRFFVGEEKAKPKVAGRPSLSDQLKLAGKRGQTPWADWTRQPVEAQPAAKASSPERTVAHAG